MRAVPSPTRTFLLQQILTIIFICGEERNSCTVGSENVDVKAGKLSSIFNNVK
jgi:hypothetical protein